MVQPSPAPLGVPHTAANLLYCVLGGHTGPSNGEAETFTCVLDKYLVDGSSCDKSAGILNKARPPHIINHNGAASGF